MSHVSFKPFISWLVLMYKTKDALLGNFWPDPSPPPALCPPHSSTHHTLTPEQQLHTPVPSYGLSDSLALPTDFLLTLWATVSQPQGYTVTPCSSHGSRQPPHGQHCFLALHLPGSSSSVYLSHETGRSFTPETTTYSHAAS